jgi:hypothetical protein
MIDKEIEKMSFQPYYRGLRVEIKSITIMSIYDIITEHMSGKRYIVC